MMLIGPLTEEEKGVLRALLGPKHFKFKYYHLVAVGSQQMICPSAVRRMMWASSEDIENDGVVAYMDLSKSPFLMECGFLLRPSGKEVRL